MTSGIRTIRLYTCSDCGKEEQWGPSWGWWAEKLTGRMRQYCDPMPKYFACSDECAKAIAKKHNLKFGDEQNGQGRPNHLKT